jgi:L-lactate dehydrogenase complex protein LldF
VKINIHEQIYAWRGVMDQERQINLTKKAALKAASNILSHPEVDQIATVMADAALKVLPHFAIYNDLNAWGKHRELPEAPKQTFQQWYRHHRLKET